LSALALVCYGTAAMAAGGLKAQYFDIADGFVSSPPDAFSGTPVLERIDKQIDFSWGNGSPQDGTVPVDKFSARWIGTLQVPTTGTYTLSLSGDDGVRLYLSEGPISTFSRIINGWVDQGTTEYTKTLDLDSTKTYNIMVEYYENGGGSVCQLRWTGPGITKDFIPESALTPGTAFPAPDTGSISGTVKDDKGATIPNVNVSITHMGDLVPVTLATDADGKYTIAAPAGDFSAVINSPAYDPGPEAKVTLKAGDAKTLNIVGVKLPTISLATADGASWKIFAYATDADAPEAATDFKQAAPNFNDSAWDAVDVPSEVSAGNPVVDNSYFWYRTKFKLPAEFSADKSRYLVFYNMKLDDDERTYLNGTLIGAHNGWNDERVYLIDPALVNFTGDNVLAIKGHQGGGGAGIDQAGWGPKIALGSVKVGALRGKVIVAGAGTPFEGLTLTVASADGKTKNQVTTASDGSYSLTGLVPGTYSLTASSPVVTAYNPTNLGVTVAGGKFNAVPDLTVTVVPFFPATLDATASDDFSKDTTKNWTSVDIGAPDPGDFSIDTANKQMVIHADGSDIWDGGDHFRYTYKKVTGDFSATLKVVNVPTTDGWSKVGLMVRASEDLNSQHFFVCATRDNGESMQGRNADDAAGNSNNNVNGGTFTQGVGYYVKMVRKGQHFDAYKSVDGVVPVLIGSLDYKTAFDKPEINLGIAATSHSAGNVGEAKVMDFRVGTDSTTPPPPVGVKGDMNGDGKLNITDVVTALRGVAGLVTLTPTQQSLADVNGDGKFNITDVVLMLRKVAGLITKFPGEA
jgi:hypothetical protein